MLKDAVENLQKELNSGGANPQLIVDGDFGAKTLAEIMKQQKPKASAPSPAPAAGHFPNKMITRAACVARYGVIDFARAHWPDQSKWLKPLEIPDGWFPNWKIMDTAQIVKRINCNIDIHAPLMAALTAVKNGGLGDLLHTFDGCHNIRMVRGSTSFSTHAYGLGLDVNAGTNQLATTHGGFYDHPEFVKCFTDQGFAWGGNFHGRKDPMHFSRAFEG